MICSGLQFKHFYPLNRLMIFHFLKWMGVEIFLNQIGVELTERPLTVSPS